METVSILMNAMKVSISEIFGTMFFMPVEFDTRPETEILIKSSPFTAASVKFSGAKTGKFVAILPLPLLKSMASCFMGVNEEIISQDDLKGTACEIINMICGNTLTCAGGDFHLDLPVIVTAGDLEKGSGRSKPSGSLCIKTSGGFFFASFYVSV